MYQKPGKPAGKKTFVKKTFRSAAGKTEGRPARTYGRRDEESGAERPYAPRRERPSGDSREGREPRPERRIGPGTEFCAQPSVKTIVLYSDVSRVFRDSRAVNEALRHLIQIMDLAKSSAPRPPRFQARSDEPYKQFGYSGPRREGPARTGTARPGGPRTGAPRFGSARPTGKRFEKRGNE